MTYVGWKIWACPFDPSGARYSLPRPTIKDLQRAFYERFTPPEWLLAINNSRVELTHTSSQTAIHGEIHPEDLTVTDQEGPVTLTYALTLRSDCFAWKQLEKEHKQLLAVVIERLPWRKAAAYLDDGVERLIYWSGPLDEDEELHITTRRWVEQILPKRRVPLKQIKPKQRGPKARRSWKKI